MKMLEGRTALVTGAGSGIGRASARLFVERARVVVADIDAQEGACHGRGDQTSRGEARFIRADVTSEASVRDMIEFVIETYGRLNMAHNHVGHGGPIGRFGTAEEQAEAAVWLCSPAASFVTGHIFPVDAGIWRATGRATERQVMGRKECR